MANKVWTTIKKGIENLSTFSLVLAGISIVLMVLLVFVEIVSRSIFNKSTLIADEMSGYMNVSIAFFGFAYAFKTNTFIRITFLYNRFSKKLKNIADVISLMLSILFSFLLLYCVWGIIHTSFIDKVTSVSISKTPLYIPQFVMVMGIAFLISQMFVVLIKKLRSFRAK